MFPATMELPSTTNCNYPSTNTVDESIRYRVSAPLLIRRFYNTRKCISSKSAWLLLMLNFNVFFLYFFWPPNFVLIPHQSLQDNVFNGYVWSCDTFPLSTAGIIADNKIRHHRMIKLSTWMLVIGISLSFATISYWKIYLLYHIPTKLFVNFNFGCVHHCNCRHWG